MGWCSGTEIFDNVGRWVLNSRMTDEEKYGVMKVLAQALEGEDWDCEQDSMYWKHPIVQKIMKELNPDWDWEDANGN